MTMTAQICHHQEMNKSDEPAERLKSQRSFDTTTKEDSETANSFRNLWRKATDDNYLTLYGFRRFRTTHLLNLRYLEKEIDTLDHQIFQAGLKLGKEPKSRDRLGLQHGKVDARAQGHEEVMTRELILKTRELISQYGKSKLSQHCTIVGLMSIMRRRGSSCLQ